MIYLDNNATTPTDPEVIKYMLPYFSDNFGNPSSIYKFANVTSTAREEARQKVANLIGAKLEEIIFTSGGTEADNLAIKGIAFANKNKRNHIITSKIEHPAVLNTCNWLETCGFKVSYLSVDKYGVVNPDELKNSLTDKTILVSIMHANNEIGTLEPIEEIAKITKGQGVFFHTDAVQTAGKLPIDINKLGVDLLSVSGHKFYGPKGIGALFIKKGVKINSLIHGGHQEKNIRPGTENIPGMVGLGKACELAGQRMPEEEKKIKLLRDKLEKELFKQIDEIYLNGHPLQRVFNTLNVSIKYVEGESILLDLDLEGIAASTGSACTSGLLEPSHVLLSTGVSSDLAQGSLRFSLGHMNTEEEIDKVIEILPKIVKRLRKMSPLYKPSK